MQLQNARAIVTGAASGPGRDPVRQVVAAPLPTAVVGYFCAVASRGFLDLAWYHSETATSGEY